MAQTSGSHGGAPPGQDSQADHSVDSSADALADDSDDEVWAPSSWDLRHGLDVAELTELPAEWPAAKPR